MYLGAIEAKNKKVETCYRRAQEVLRAERQMTRKLEENIEDLAAQFTELIKKLGELSSSTEGKRKRSPAPNPLSSDSEDDTPAAAWINALLGRSR